MTDSTIAEKASSTTFRAKIRNALRQRKGKGRGAVRYGGERSRKRIWKRLGREASTVDLDITADAAAGEVGAGGGASGVGELDIIADTGGEEGEDIGEPSNRETLFQVEPTRNLRPICWMELGGRWGVDIRKRVGAGNESFRFVFFVRVQRSGALYSCEIFSVPMQECLFLFSARLGFENSGGRGGAAGE